MKYIAMTTSGWHIDDIDRQLILDSGCRYMLPSSPLLQAAAQRFSSGIRKRIIVLMEAKKISFAISFLVALHIAQIIRDAQEAGQRLIA